MLASLAKLSMELPCSEKLQKCYCKSRENWREEEFYLILIDSFSPLLLLQFRIDGLLVNSKILFPFKS